MSLMVVSRFTSRVLFYLCLLSTLVYSAQIEERQCLKPSVRREWRAISEREREEWVRAVKCLAHLPHNNSLTTYVDPSLSLIPSINTSSSLYDDISYMHMDLNVLIHYTGRFLPWHRLFLNGFEKLMKEKCEYKGSHPYWDWTIDAHDFYHSSLLNPSPKSGFGGWGDPDNDLQVSNGAFHSDFIMSYPVPHIIRRNFTLQPSLGQNRTVFGDGSWTVLYDDDRMSNLSITRKSQEDMVNGFIGNFEGFQAFMEGSNGSHPAVHLMISGDMLGKCPKDAPANCIVGPKWSPNDPLFWMHHGMIDKLWYDWQHRHKANFWSFHGGAVGAHKNATVYEEHPNGAPPYLKLDSLLPGDGIMEDLTIYDVMNTTNGKLCYVYE